jgi:predicted nucleotidyltransferase
MPSRTEILAILRGTEQRILATAPTTRLYLFGSFQRDDAGPADVDVLVVYAHPSEVPPIRLELARLADRLPLHVTYLDEGEAVQLDFISRQSCVPISLST